MIRKLGSILGATSIGLSDILLSLPAWWQSYLHGVWNKGRAVRPKRHNPLFDINTWSLLGGVAALKESEAACLREKQLLMY